MLDLEKFRSVAEETVENRRPEIRNPKTDEDYYVLDKYRFDGLIVSNLGTSKLYLIAPEQAKLLKAKDRQSVRLQGLALQSGCILCVFNPARSALADAFREARGEWSRHRYDHGAKKYTVSKAPEQHPKPDLPFNTLNDFVAACFGDRIVDREDHPALLNYGKSGR